MNSAKPCAPAWQPPHSPAADVRFLFNHDGLPRARTISSTLEINDTATALQMTARLDRRQQLPNDLSIAIERGDVSQMSVGFTVESDEWDDEMDNREIHSFGEFLDVSAVTFPASPSTSISNVSKARSLRIAKGQVEPARAAALLGNAPKERFTDHAIFERARNRQQLFPKHRIRTAIKGRGY